MNFEIHGASFFRIIEQALRFALLFNRDYAIGFVYERENINKVRCYRKILARNHSHHYGEHQKRERA